ncbi:type VII secretion protein, YukD family [Vagococcus fluvialis]|jgi:uncharacterized ubiquitin-like protein YukD|uniref:type VII secretion protein, YukD family n=1 Tax=Vagococcus fluvialis TaxID=2738 RepID=UPI001A8CAEEF|nr:type VII secretion protein, YukD family [Vagococcus fluvialis]MBO0428799.1 type VII secretion protein, YukD family [Vagococcus fluvialis]
MKKGMSIGIGLHIGNQIIDLQVPNQVSIERLKELLRESVALLKIELPEEFELKLINKPLIIDNQVKLANYPISNGDQFVINTIVRDMEE